MTAGFFTIATLAFIVLKLTGLITLSWWWILLTALPMVVFGFVFISMVIVAIIVFLVSAATR